MASNILEAYKVRLRQEMNDIADSMIDGSCLGEDDAGKIAVAYAKAVGVIEGFARAERALLDVSEEAEKREQQDT